MTLRKIHYNFKNISLPSQDSWRNIQEENLMKDIQKKLMNNCISKKYLRQFSRSPGIKTTELFLHVYIVLLPLLRTTEPSQICFAHFSKLQVPMLEKEYSSK